ncbi:hypothetical protein O181_083945 [Austropuccinia psidii MF-1]|uniref:Uncharacterized protein n=1 Tax=Austropuccinia psidii MF-1 TaxID=1389203 RepID=A0A9Q3FP68_9BASI|nr:hypothetical protein [Austropuccinia psidii MF-1]
MLRFQIAIKLYRGSIHKIAYGLIRWTLANTPDIPVYSPLAAEPQSSIEAINITDIGTKFFEEVRDSDKQDNNFHILTCLLGKDCKDTALVNSLDVISKFPILKGDFTFLME